MHSKISPIFVIAEATAQSQISGKVFGGQLGFDVTCQGNRNYVVENNTDAYALVLLTVVHGKKDLQVWSAGQFDTVNDDNVAKRCRLYESRDAALTRNKFISPAHFL